MLFRCIIDLWIILVKIRSMTFEFGSKWRPSAGARYARARPHAMCKFDFFFIKIIHKALYVNGKFWHSLTAAVLFLLMKTRNPNLGYTCFKSNSGTHFALRQLFSVLFGCYTHLSVYWVKIRSITLKIRSQRWFEFDFTFCTCSAKRLDEIVYS